MRIYYQEGGYNVSMDLARSLPVNRSLIEQFTGLFLFGEGLLEIVNIKNDHCVTLVIEYI